MVGGRRKKKYGVGVGTIFHFPLSFSNGITLTGPRQLQQAFLVRLVK